jgi:REP element-mobilizing transposase RayT
MRPLTITPMPRQMRIEYPGAIYHVMSRGDRREKIFLDDVDRQDFLKTLAETCQKTGFLVHAYCLMPNHFHWVLETPEANLVAGMTWLLSTYTIRFNHRHKLSGHLFGGRYKALVVEGGGTGYLKTVCDYVHLNPVRANLLKAEEKLAAYPWSSLLWYGAAREHRPAWLGVARLLGEHGMQEDSARNREAFMMRMEARRLVEEDEESLAPIRRGWCLGSEPFRQELLAKLDGQAGEFANGKLRQEHGESRAERIISEELKQLGWTEEELERARKNAPGKMAIAARLRRETTLTLKWIAARLHLGTSKSANARVHQWMRDNPITVSVSCMSPMEQASATKHQEHARKTNHAMA